VRFVVGLGAGVGANHPPRIKWRDTGRPMSEENGRPPSSPSRSRIGGWVLLGVVLVLIAIQFGLARYARRQM
jgi:hypothetical protein